MTIETSSPPAEPAATANRVVVLAPLGRDAAVICGVLEEADISSATAADVDELSALVRQGSGAVLLTEEALTPSGIAAFTTTLSAQPSWSDLPVLLLLASGEEAQRPAARLALAHSVASLRNTANLTILVRPVPAVALATAVQAALRARRRQYEVRDLIARERTARLQAETATRLKDEFLTTVSHELRTPLSAILLWSRLLASGRVAPHEIPTALQSIEHSAEAQSHLIEDLLDVSQMFAGKLRLNLQEGELGPLAEEAVAVVRPMAEAKRIGLTARIDAAAGPVRADPDRIQQVIWNLLSNAIKFTPAGGRVSLELRREHQDALLSVADTGRGIAPEFLPHVFERFRQADAAATRRPSGLGLGLAITQQLIELHGGSTAVASPGLDQGTIFLVRLPLSRVPGHAGKTLPKLLHRHRGSSDA